MDISHHQYYYFAIWVPRIVRSTAQYWPLTDLRSSVTALIWHCSTYNAKISNKLSFIIYEIGKATSLDFKSVCTQYLKNFLSRFAFYLLFDFPLYFRWKRAKSHITGGFHFNKGGNFKPSWRRWVNFCIKSIR